MRRPSLQVINLPRRRYHSILEVENEDCSTVSDNKKSIATQQNLSVTALLNRGVPLNDSRLLEKLLPDLRIGPPRFANHTRVRPRTVQGGVSVIVVIITTGKRFQVMLPSLDSTLLELKEVIRIYEGIFSDHWEGSALKDGGRNLHDDFTTLRQYALEPGCEVHLCSRLSGGGPGTAPDLPGPVGFVDVGNTSLLRKSRLDPKGAPPWRVSEEGLSLQGKCRE